MTIGPKHWLVKTLREYITQERRHHGLAMPDEETLAAAIAALLPHLRARIMVQEPWNTTIRFKTLIWHEPGEWDAYIEEPMGTLLERYGGGKYKINLYAGMHSVGTYNFKPQGAPLWEHLPEAEEPE